MHVVVLIVLLLAGCDYVFRIDHVDPAGDASSAMDDGNSGNDSRDTMDAAALPPCPPARTSVVASYPVDGDEGSMQLTDHGPNSVHGGITGAALATTTGPTDCGVALQIINGREVVIPYDDKFQLASGSIDLWVRPIVLNNGISRVIVARDSGGNNRGDFTLFEHRMSSGEYIFVVRLQSGDPNNNGGGTLRCSNNSLVTSTSWYHVSVNFGPPTLELEVNGVTQSRTSTITINGENMTCGTSTTGQSATVGVDGTPPKPWFIGFGDVYEAQAIMRVFLSSGGIDGFRVSSERF